jgi:hypothetical protein
VVPFAPEDFAREEAALVAASGATGAGIATPRRRNPRAALRAARFVNLLPASLLAGNGVGGERVVRAPLRHLRPSHYLEAEQATTRSYLSMLAVMPAAAISGLLVQTLPPDHRRASFWLTLAGTLGMAGTQMTTLVELPLNQQTLTTAPRHRRRPRAGRASAWRRSSRSSANRNVREAASRAGGSMRRECT